MVFKYDPLAGFDGPLICREVAASMCNELKRRLRSAHRAMDLTVILSPSASSSSFPQYRKNLGDGGPSGPCLSRTPRCTRVGRRGDGRQLRRFGSASSQARSSHHFRELGILKAQISNLVRRPGVRAYS